MDVRHANESDFSEITEILNHYIVNTDARYFESEPISLESRKIWLAKFGQQTPHQMFVAVENNELLGFCCSQPYRPESAYDKTIEVSVYISPKSTSSGVGSLLYKHLFESLDAFDLHRAIAGIALPNDVSVSFHKKFNFKQVGIFDEYGLKNDKFISAIWLQKKL
ncbi:GNAT family N-acetyltransferase [Marinomonas sp. TW1]|uniref:GNAT family N-acetyltransferase n=1 Tax=Marinomonas sp. TW1 TaxID=1561203 RepID=UPI0007AFD62E|nr:GNAT family N-acetyltransferase [Marinomonas sp. TW1]KZN13099.1 GCN5 family acetyltransferase [Marinomonas sp. TW1]